MNRAASAMILVALSLTACGGDEPPPPGTFPPLHYDYLTKLRLNVGSIDVQDHSAPLGPDDVSAQSPITPAQALMQIGHDRLFAAGLQGSAQFVIDQASIVRGAQGGLYGQMAVHLDVLTPGGARGGFAEARVSQQHLPGSDEENMPTILYDMTRKMADNMNVELEYQMKRSMGDFLASADVVPSTVSAVPLTPGGALPLSANPPPVDTYHPNLAPPSQLAPSDEAPFVQGAPPSGTTPDQPGADAPLAPMSPPPGYLQLPNGPGQ